MWRSLCFLFITSFLVCTARAGVSVVSGHGVAAVAGMPVELRVRFTDAQGARIQGVQIDWSPLQGGGSLSMQSTRTNADGESAVNFTGFLIPQEISSLSVIAATAPDGQRAEFYVTTVRGSMLEPAIVVEFPPTETPIAIRAGEVLPGAIRAIVRSNAMSLPLANIGMRILQRGPEQPLVSCRDSVPLSDATGEILCDLKAGPVTGETTITVRVGELRDATYRVSVKGGVASGIRIVSGDGQRGAPGEQTQAAVVEVTDAAGGKVPGSAVAWEMANLELVTSQGTTDANGRAAAVVRFPRQPGTGTLTARAANSSVTFTFVVPGTQVLAVVSGDGQVVGPGQTSRALQVRVTDQQRVPIRGATVAFAVTTGDANVLFTTSQTDDQGLASTVVVGGRAGDAVVTASCGSAASVRFNLTVRPLADALTALEVRNAAGGQPGVSPGSLATISAAGLTLSADELVVGESIMAPRPVRLNGIRVQFNGIDAPIVAASATGGEGQLTVQVPFEVQPGSASVAMETRNGAATLSEVLVTAVKPGIFTFRDVDGKTYGVATRFDGSYVTSANPAQAGEVVRVYATGLGQTAPATGTNRVGVPGQTIGASIIAGVNDAGVRVLSTELLPGMVGVYAVALEVPATNVNSPRERTHRVVIAATGPDGADVFSNTVLLPIR